MKLCTTSHLTLVLLLTITMSSHPCGISYPSLDTESIGALAFSPDGSLLITANESTDSVTVFEFNKGKLSNSKTYNLPSHSKSPQALAFSPDGEQVATANTGSDNITIFSNTRGKLSNSQSYALPSGSTSPQSIAFSGDGIHIATANLNDITLFTFSSGTVTKTQSYTLPTGSNSPRAIAFSSDGAHLATANKSSNDVTMFSVVAEGLINNKSYPLPTGSKSPQAITFSPHSSVVTANSASNDVTVFSISEGTLISGISYKLPHGAKSPTAVSFSSDGTLLAVGDGGSNNLIVFNVDDEILNEDTTTYTLSASALSRQSVMFAPNTTFFASFDYFFDPKFGEFTDIVVFDTSAGCRSSKCGTGCAWGITVGAIAAVAAACAGASFFIKNPVNPVHFARRAASERTSLIKA